MSDTDQTDGKPAEGTTPPPTTDPATDSGKAPKFDGEFDPERAARLVANLRAELEAKTAKLKEHEDAGKTELEKAQARAQAAEEALAKSRLEAATATAAKTHSIPDDLLEFITGATADEIEAKAKRLGERLAAANGTPATTDTPPGTRPRPQLVPGQGSSADAGTFDPAAIARAARRR